MTQATALAFPQEDLAGWERIDAVESSPLLVDPAHFPSNRPQAIVVKVVWRRFRFERQTAHEPSKENVGS